MDTKELLKRIKFCDQKTRDICATMKFEILLAQDVLTALGEMRRSLTGVGIGPIKPYSQTDARWADKIYSGTGTFGGHGCYVTCATMIASQAYPDLTPPDMAEIMRNANCFGPCAPGLPPNCLNRIDRVTSVLDKLRYDGAKSWRTTPMPVEELQDALHEGPVIAEVDARPGGDLNQHFVVITAIAGDGRDAEIIDSYDGKWGFLLKKYGKPGWDLGRAVYGIRLLRVQKK